MAYDPSSDADCQCWFRFESGAMDVDSTGQLGAPGTLSGDSNEDTADYKEGSCSAEFLAADSDDMYATDGQLPTAFPGKGGESIAEMTVAFWVKFITLPATNGYMGIITKTTFNQNIWRVDVKDTGGTPTMRFCIGYNNGSSLEYVLHASTVSTGVWYHVGVTFDNSDKSYRIRIYDATAAAILGSDLTGTSTNNMTTGEACYLTLGADKNFATQNYLNGNIDDVVVFDRVLDQSEIDGLRQQNYPVSGGGGSEFTSMSMGINF